MAPLRVIHTQLRLLKPEQSLFSLKRVRLLRKTTLDLPSASSSKPFVELRVKLQSLVFSTKPSSGTSSSILNLSRMGSLCPSRPVPRFLENEGKPICTTKQAATDRRLSVTDVEA